VNLTDQFAFYQVPSSVGLLPTMSCASFGYIYYVNSGLCVTTNKTSNAFSEYQGAVMALEPCYSCNTTFSPPKEQLFCTDAWTVGFYDSYQCAAFYGDALPPYSFYGQIYGSGPGSVESKTMLDAGFCIFIPFGGP
jgi:hypothetical protein